MLLKHTNKSGVNNWVSHVEEQVFKLFTSLGIFKQAFKWVFHWLLHLSLCLSALKNFLGIKNEY